MSRQLTLDVGIKKDIWSVMEDFAKASGDKDLNKMKTQYQMFVDDVSSKPFFPVQCQRTEIDTCLV